MTPGRLDNILPFLKSFLSVFKLQSPLPFELSICFFLCWFIVRGSRVDMYLSPSGFSNLQTWYSCDSDLFLSHGTCAVLSSPHPWTSHTPPQHPGVTEVLFFFSFPTSFFHERGTWMVLSCNRRYVWSLTGVEYKLSEKFEVDQMGSDVRGSPWPVALAFEARSHGFCQKIGWAECGKIIYCISFLSLENKVSFFSCTTTVAFKISSSVPCGRGRNQSIVSRFKWLKILNYSI